jgi:hypothetical protein
MVVEYRGIGEFCDNGLETQGRKWLHMVTLLITITICYDVLLSVETVANLLPLQDISLNRLHLKKE